MYDTAELEFHCEVEAEIINAKYDWE
jgi:hypothetical protein